MSSIYRTINTQLLAWKQRPSRKPLVLRGARQVGKTHALQEFGEREFRTCHLVNFQELPELSSLFDGALTAATIIESLQLALDIDIDISHDLLIFDEIQDCPRALISVKYFCEQMPELALCCAGSLLGVVHAEASFPVGKVSFMDLYPLTFIEFLGALGEQRMADFVVKLGRQSVIAEPVHQRLQGLLQEYLVVGGLPEVVDLYRDIRSNRKQAFEQVRGLQQDLLNGYIRDFAQHSAGVRPDRLLAVLTSIPAQLAKESKKFVTSKVISGGRYSILQSAVDWLEGAGLVLKVPIANVGELPFSAFTQENRFKLYFFDTGLLGALAQLSPAVLVTEADLFATFKGAFCENFVAQEFTARGKPLYSWASNTAEIEFMLEVDGQVLPVEVKSGNSGKLKSLNVFAQKYRSPYRTRFSARNLEINQKAAMHSYPLYLSGRFPLA
ncbi:MAG: ATP-binding protein [Immundisolibacteraceae bacterium]|nr:ATP-binding protein [Immundisolibacteraceae bacterium]